MNSRITRRGLFAAGLVVPVTMSGPTCVAAEQGVPATTRKVPRTAAPAGPPAIPVKPGERLPDAYREIDPVTGMQKGYAVLPEAERAKGFVRPVREVYTHTACGENTRMSRAIAETMARNPKFYGSGYCIRCRMHFPLSQFVWTGTTEVVGS